MKTISRSLAAALLMSAGMALTAAPALAAKEEKAPAGPKLSKPVVAQLGEVQKLSKAGDNAGALAKIKDAEALPGLTPEEVFVINQFKLNAAIGLKDQTVQEQAINAMLETGKVPAADLVKFTTASAQLAYQRKDYAKSTAGFEKIVQLAPTDTDSMYTLAELYRVQKQNAKAVATLTNAINVAKANGKPVPEDWYRRQFGIGYDNKLPQTPDLASALIQAYPNPVNWRDVLNFSRDMFRNDDQGLLDLLRLQSTVNALNGESDYIGYAETALEKGLPGEASAVIKQGIAANMVKATKQNVIEIQKVASAKIPKDKADLPALERDAAKSPKVALITGDAYYGYGEYGKAASLYRMAAASPVVDADTANLRLGAALARSGDKAGAATAFKAVKAGPRATLAKYWLAYIGPAA